MKRNAGPTVLIFLVFTFPSVCDMIKKMCPEVDPGNGYVMQSIAMGEIKAGGTRKKHDNSEQCKFEF